MKHTQDKSKKSQMEILGLAIVVVLLLVASMFVYVFFGNAQKNLRSTFISSQLASNTVNTFLKTTASSCLKRSMTELIQDCALIGNFCENGQDSCSYVRFAANTIFNQTLDEWKIKYEFLIYSDARRPIADLGEKCKGEKKSQTFPVPTDAEGLQIFAKLDICS